LLLLLLLMSSSSSSPCTCAIFVTGHLAFDHHHHISIMELGHLLPRSGLTYPEVSSKVCHDSFCHSPNHSGVTVSSGMEEIPSLNMPVQRLMVAILPLDLPGSGPVTHSGEILTTGKSHGKKPDRFGFWCGSQINKYYYFYLH
jgi:hypothetical protein